MAEGTAEVDQSLHCVVLLLAKAVANDAEYLRRRTVQTAISAYKVSLISITLTAIMDYTMDYAMQQNSSPMPSFTTQRLVLTL